MSIVRHVGRPSRAATADREALAPAMLGDAVVWPVRRLDRGRGGVVSGRPLPCPKCGARLFLEPQTDTDASLAPYEFLCLACGCRVATV